MLNVKLRGKKEQKPKTYRKTPPPPLVITVITVVATAADVD